MTGYAIVKSLHVVFMVTWFAGLFYLPRLFVYHAMTTDAAGIERFKIMERKLFFGIMTPGAVLTIVFGLWLMVGYGVGLGPGNGWLHAKLALVVLLIVYHLWCGSLLFAFRADRNTHSHVFYRWFNEFPVIVLLLVVFLVIGKPF